MPALPALPVSLLFGLELSIAGVAALVFGPSRWRRLLAWLLAGAALALPWLAPRDALVARAFLGLVSSTPFLRLVDFTRDRTAWPWWHRAWQMLVPYDAREVKYVGPGFDARALVGLVLYGGLLAGSVALARWLAPPATLAQHAASLLVATVATYALLDTGSAFIRLTTRAVGGDVPPLQHAPILAESAGEFWGERWNHTVNRWLRRNCFMPWARRRRPRVGLWSAFVASALLHVWVVLVPLGAPYGLAMGLYFVIQGGVVALEPRLGVKRWPRPLRHAWTVLAVAGPGPLFVSAIQAVIVS